MKSVLHGGADDCKWPSARYGSLAWPASAINASAWLDSALITLLKTRHFGKAVKSVEREGEKQVGNVWEGVPLSAKNDKGHGESRGAVDPPHFSSLGLWMQGAGLRREGGGDI